MFASLAYEIITNNELLWLEGEKTTMLNPAPRRTLFFSTTGTDFFWGSKTGPKGFRAQSFSFYPPSLREHWRLGLARSLPKWNLSLHSWQPTEYSCVVWQSSLSLVSAIFILSLNTHLQEVVQYQKGNKPKLFTNLGSLVDDWAWILGWSGRVKSLLI